MSAKSTTGKHRDGLSELASLKFWGDPPDVNECGTMKHEVALDCGWGRLIFGQTFDEPERLAQILRDEAYNERDVAFYVRDPHVVLAAAPQELFLDPSHSFRLDLAKPVGETKKTNGLTVRKAREEDAEDINRLYKTWSMVPLNDGFCVAVEKRGPITVLVAVDDDDITGVAMGIDHKRAFNDPDNGSSLWALAVDPQARRPGIGRILTLALAGRFRKAGRAFMDISVLHDNHEAIALYRKLGFEQVPVFTVKKKNPINEKLFVGPPGNESDLNIYARIIVDEARRRGIRVEVEDSAAGIFQLTLGGRTLSCRESLSDLTSAVSLSRCDDKTLTRRLLARAGLSVPDQMTAESTGDVRAFCQRYDSVVVKPAQGEQGRGVAVDLSDTEEIDAAIARAGAICNKVILEEYVSGQDLRIIVIGGEVVAAAIRRPPSVKGDGILTVRELVEKLSRRRANATNGESRIPFDEETERCVAASGLGLDDVLAPGKRVTVRKTANLHTGGTIHDVTDRLAAPLREAAEKAAGILNMPLVGFDFIVEDETATDYRIIEANERPGLANHEPQPTAERFVDLLFPETKADQRFEGAHGK